MKAPDDEVMVVDIGELFLVDGVVREEGVLVAVIVKGGLVGDDQIGVQSDGAAEDVRGVGETCHYAGNDCGRVAGLDGVYRISRRLLRNGLLDARNRLGRGEVLLRQKRDWHEQRGDESESNPHGIEGSRYWAQGPDAPLTHAG